MKHVMFFAFYYHSHDVLFNTLTSPHVALLITTDTQLKSIPDYLLQCEGAQRYENIKCTAEYVNNKEIQKLLLKRLPSSFLNAIVQRGVCVCGQMCSTSKLDRDWWQDSIPNR